MKKSHIDLAKTTELVWIFLAKYSVVMSICSMSGTELSACHQHCHWLWLEGDSMLI